MKRVRAEVVVWSLSVPLYLYVLPLPWALGGLALLWLVLSNVGGAGPGGLPG